jgi:prepilin-type N-terminal cleavage/methylation domain-containing protein
MHLPSPVRHWPIVRHSGFTVVELMVTILVSAVLIALAAPLYKEVRERSIVRGATGDLVAAFQQAKLEAAKRNDYVTVSVRGGPGATWCIGVQTGATGCDCLADTCTVTQVNADSLNGARLLALADFNDAGGGSGGSTDVTIDPRLGMIRDFGTGGFGTGGSLVLASPSTAWDFRVQFNLSSTAQTNLCSPAVGRPLSEYAKCP